MCVDAKGQFAGTCGTRESQDRSSARSARAPSGTKKPCYSDIARKDYKGYMEPILLSGADHQAGKIGITRSKYIRYAVINQLIKDGYPLKDISSKFNAFYRGITQNR